MDIDTEQTDLCHFAEAHQQRIDHLRARIDRSMREIRVHEVIRDLADNSALPNALRSLVKMPSTEWATSRDVRVFLAEYGVSVPAEWDIRVQCTADDFAVVATNRDDWFPASLSWSSSEGFNGRITNNSWRELPPAAQTRHVITMGAITELHWVNNYSGSALTITNLEPDPTFEVTCPPGRSTFISEQWVPWCSRGSDFAAHHMVITLNGVTFFVWQDTDSDGNWVRLSTAGFTSSSLPPEFIPAEHFPGNALEGGDRNVEVLPDGGLRLVNA